MPTRSMTCFTYRHDDPARKQKVLPPAMEKEILEEGARESMRETGLYGAL